MSKPEDYRKDFKYGSNLLYGISPDGILEIKFHNLKQKNIFRVKTNGIFARLFKEANENDKIKMILIYGTPEIFCGGNNLSGFEIGFDEEKKRKLSESLIENYLIKMLSAMLDCEKPIVAMVRGPAIGIGATMLSLCDFVYCTPDSYFSTPFMATYQSPEGTSSYFFPKYLGNRFANEMLMRDKIMTAKQAKHLGYVNDILTDFPTTDFFDVTRVPCVSKLLSNNTETMRNAKRLLIQGYDRESVLKCIDMECKALHEIWMDPVFPDKLMLYLLKLKQSSLEKEKKKKERAKL